MKIITKDITIANEALTLTNQRAIYWKAQNALILSDLHIGKTAHFRKNGIPMPDDILREDLERLRQLINHFKALKLLIVGDLFHAENNSNMITFEAWLSQQDNLEITLIKGNHDRQPNRLLKQLNISVHIQLLIPPFNFIHEPTSVSSDKFTISGHLHPGVLLKGKGKQKLKLPCYMVSSSQLILPAFSLFTGLNTKTIVEGAVHYAFTDTAVFEI